MPITQTSGRSFHFWRFFKVFLLRLNRLGQNLTCYLHGILLDKDDFKLISSENLLLMHRILGYTLVFNPFMHIVYKVIGSNPELLFEECSC